MKLAIVHDFLTKVGGAEKVLAAFAESYPEAPVYTLLYNPDNIGNLFAGHQPRIITSSLNKYPNKIKKLLLPKYPQAIEEFDFSDYDIVISFSNTYAHGILTKPKTFHLCYCYSPMRYAWDWYHEYLAENNIGFGPKGMIVRNMLHQTRIWDRLAAHRVDKWLTQSKTTQSRIKKYFKADSTVIYPPIDIDKIKTAVNEPDDYFLVVSRLEPYKKIDLAIETCKKINRHLIIIGEGSDKNRLESIADDNIEFLGWQSDEKVFEYMRNSYAFVFPGEEDFGLTPVESMAAGRPVIAFRKGGVTETIIDNETGIFFNEQTVESVKQAIEKLDENYYNFSVEKCVMQANKFSKTVFLSRMQQVINESLKQYNDYNFGRKN